MDKDLKNMMETIVEQRLDEMLPYIDCCKCETCKKDIMAIVLNRLPAKYVVTEKGALISRLSTAAKQSSTDLTANILQAAEIVGKNPNH